jgi:hypothetical protein
MAPHLAVTPTGEAIMSWLEPGHAESHALRYSTLQDDTWSKPKTVAKDTGWFVNWADIPSVVPISANKWAAHWLVKRQGGTYAYDIAMSMSADGGTTWAAPLTPHADNTPTEHGFVTMFPWSGGVGAVWLDGRNMAPDLDGERSAENFEQDGGMTLRFARLSYEGELLESGEIDDLVCECCQTDVAITKSGPIVAYRNRTADEIRDISVTRYDDGSWTEPTTVSDDRWRIPGCPVNGPAIVADGERVAVTWYGAPNRETRVKLAWSDDAGKTFGTPIIIDKSGSRGRVDVALINGGSAIVTWVAKTGDDSGQFRMRKISRHGEPGPIQVIAGGAYSRKSGVPQMVSAGNRLIFAWPESGEPGKVLTAYASLEN